MKTILSHERRGRGETVVFLHGFLGTGEDWKAVVEGLADGYDCVLVDLPGHGKSVDVMSEKGDGLKWNLERMATRVVELLDALGLEKPHLVGYSMGGRLALYLGLYHGERFRSLVLESASPGLTDEGERAARAALDRQRGREIVDKGLKAFVDDWYGMEIFAGIRDTPGFEAMLARRRRGEATALARVMEEMSPGRQPDLWPMLDRLRTPTLWLAGERDEKYVSIAQRATSTIANARVEVISNAGHNLHVEAPAMFACSVRRFWATL